MGRGVLFGNDKPTVRSALTLGWVKSLVNIFSNGSASLPEKHNS